MVSLSVFWGIFMLKKSGLFFKSPVATVSLKRKLGSFIMSMPANATWHVRNCALYPTHSVLPFFIGLNRLSRNTSKHLS